MVTGGSGANGLKLLNRWFAVTWWDGHVGGQNNSKLWLVFCIIIESNSQKTFSLLFCTPTWPRWHQVKTIYWDLLRYIIELAPNHQSRSQFNSFKGYRQNCKLGNNQPCSLCSLTSLVRKAPVCWAGGRRFKLSSRPTTSVFKLLVWSCWLWFNTLFQFKWLHHWVVTFKPGA